MTDAAPAKNGETTPKVEETLPSAVLDKYKAAALCVHSAVKALLADIKQGANVLDLCKKGDAALESETGKVYNFKGAKQVQKGIAYPTSLAINNTLCHFSPLPSDTENAALTLKDGDLVKVVMGAHIDGYATLAGETIVVGSSSVDGEKADLLTAAHNAVEYGLRHAKIGGKNMEITDAIAALVADYGGQIKGVEGMISNQHLQNDIQARKTIHTFASTEHRRDSANSFILEEGEVYHLDVMVTNSQTSQSKTSPAPTTIYSKTGTTKYALKMKAARTTYSEITNKAGQFPFTLRLLEAETKARLGVVECVQHGLLRAYEPLQLEKTTDLSAQLLVTFALTKSGVVKLSHAPVFFSPESVKPAHTLKEEFKEVIARPLKAIKKKTKKTKDGEEPASEAKAE